MASVACCAAGPPVVCDYKPTGTIAKIGDVETYFVGAGPKGVIVIYDIFGFSPQMKQVCDKIAEAGFNVAMPHFVAGKEWLVENFPPKDKSELKAWFSSVGDWDSSIQPTFKAALAHMKEEKGCKSIIVAGFCWGGKMSMTAATMGPESGIKAVGVVHPAMLTPELAEEVKVPMLIMPSGDDPDHTPIKEVLDRKPFGDKCKYRRFDDMHHGFCAARGDWKIPEQSTRASEAIGTFVEFFKANTEE